MIVNAYIDESYGDKIFVLGGYIAKLGQWNRLEKSWGKLLTKFHIDYFHSKEMVHRNGKFSDWDDMAELSFCAKAEKLCRDKGLCGFTSRIDFADYRRDYREYQGQIKGYNLDSIYGLAFRYILTYIPNFVDRSLSRDDVIVNFILEDSQYFGDAHRIFNDVKKKFPYFERILGTITPGSKRIKALQAADALATGAYRLERDNEIEFVEVVQDTVTLRGLRLRRLPRAPAIHTHATPEMLRGIKDAAKARREYNLRRAKAVAEPEAILMPEADPSAEGSS